MIPITKPVFGPEELRAVQRPLESGWVVQGPFVREFEQKFGAFVGSPHAIATSSCTTALHIAMAALGVGPGDEVIVPAFTWISTANVVEYMGARPVFCDVDLSTFNVDPARVEEAATESTVGLLPVHLFGLCADMDALLPFGARRGVWVVEDAACGFGASLNGRHAGTMGELGCFSFHPRKSITTGEGGMITTARDDLRLVAESLRDHGASRSDFARHAASGAFLLADYEHLGYNYRMTDLQGAVGSAQMDRAAWILAERARRARCYDELLAELEWLRRPRVPTGHVHGYQAYVCLFAPEEPALHNAERLSTWRNDVMRHLETRGIATRPGTHAPVLQGFYRERYGFRVEDFPNAYLADRLTLTLPLYPQMTDDDQALVVRELRGALAAVRS